MSKYFINDQTYRPVKQGSSPIRKLPSGQLRTVETLRLGDLRLAVRLPEGEDLNEWIAKNLIDFYHQVSMIYATITEFCTNENCPVMSAGSGFKYLWYDESTAKPVELSAPQYIIKLFRWIDNQIENEAIFPSAMTTPFPENFMGIVTNIMRRLFRVYAHVYYHHLQHFSALGTDKHLNTSFKHFILFVSEFNLISKDQLEPLSDMIDAILSS